MSTVAIVGAGALGGAIAHTLAGGDRVRDIRLIDTAQSVAAGKALDIQQAGAVEAFSTTLSAHRDLSASLGASLIVLAEPVLAGPDEAATALSVLRSLAELNRQAIIICAGAEHQALVERGVAQTGLERHRLVGSAPLAYQAALRAIVAVDLECSVRDVSLTVLGVPPDRWVVPWTEASVRGVPLPQLLTPLRLRRLQDKASRVWPVGPYALAAATVRLCELILSGTASYGVPCFVVLDGELGVRGQAVAATVAITASGVQAIMEPSLSVQERVQLETAVQGGGRTG